MARRQHGEIHAAQHVQQPPRLGILAHPHQGERQQTCGPQGHQPGHRQCPSLPQHPRHPCPARRFPARAVPQDVRLRVRRPAAEEHLSDRNLVCPAALPAVHVARQQPTEHAVLPPLWRPPADPPGTPAGAQLRQALRWCPADAALAPRTLDSVHSRALGGTGCLRPRAPRARGSAVPVRTSAASLRVTASPVGGQHAGPCPRAPWRAAGPETPAPPAARSVWCPVCMPGGRARASAGTARATEAVHTSP